MSVAGKVGSAAGKGQGLLNSITSSEFYGALKETGIGGALAGGGLGMVANAGYNYSTDQHGGYMGSAMAGAGIGALGAAAWAYKGKDLYHTASGKVKQQVMTDSGTKAFQVRSHDNLKVQTDLYGNHDLAGQKKLVKDMDAKLAGMDATHANYDRTIKEREAAYNGLDHMQSVIDNKLSQSDIGARKLKDRYEGQLNTMKGTDRFRDLQEFNDLRGVKTGLKKELQTVNNDLKAQRRAFNAFRKAGGDVNSDEGRAFRSRITDAVAAKNAVGNRAISAAETHGKRYKDLATLMNTPGMKQFTSDLGTVAQKVKAAESLIGSKAISNDLNMGLV